MLPCGQLMWLEGVIAPATDHMPQTGGLNSRRFWRLESGICVPADRVPGLQTVPCRCPPLAESSGLPSTRTPVPSHQNPTLTTSFNPISSYSQTLVLPVTAE